MGDIYEWIITEDRVDEKNATKKIPVLWYGPFTNPNYEIDEIIREGAKFRLLDSDYKVCYVGYWIGIDSEGGNPLTDFGVYHGCCMLDVINVKGEWETAIS